MTKPMCIAVVRRDLEGKASPSGGGFNAIWPPKYIVTPCPSRPAMEGKASEILRACGI